MNEDECGWRRKRRGGRGEVRVEADLLSLDFLEFTARREDRNE